MTFSHHHLSRRNFNKALVAFTVTSGFMGTSIAKAKGGQKADGLIHLDGNGKINVYSGIANYNPYSDDNSVVVISDVLNCSYNDLTMNVGNNPIHLPGMLGQHCNNISFSSIATNQAAAEVLKSELLQRVESRFGVVAKDLRLFDGNLEADGQVFALKNLLQGRQNTVVRGDVSQKTKDIAKCIKETGITVMVNEVL